MEADSAIYHAAVRRISVYSLVLSLSGVAAAGSLEGWPGAVGFALGSGLSWLNFHWIRRLVESLGAAAKPKRAAGFAVVLGLRYALLGGIGYVMLKFFGVSLLAVLAGLLAVVAAVILEAVYQLITYAGT